MSKKIIFILSLMLSAAGYGLAQTDCPFGLTDDPAPGQCGRYIDNNGDNICDNSQDLAQSSGASSGGQEDNEPSEDQISSADSAGNIEEFTDEQQAETLSLLETETPAEITSVDDPEATEADPSVDIPVKPRRPNYHPWLLLFIIAVLVIAGEIWQKQDKKKIALIQLFWNWALLISFLASAMTGIYFILPPVSRPMISFNLVYWHTVTGLVFMYVGLYHVVRRAACLTRGAKTCVKKTPCC